MGQDTVIASPWAPEGEYAPSVLAPPGPWFCERQPFSYQVCAFEPEPICKLSAQGQMHNKYLLLLLLFFHYSGKLVQERRSAKPGSRERQESVPPGKANACKIARCHFSADKWVGKCTSRRGGCPWGGVLWTHKGNSETRPPFSNKALGRPEGLGRVCPGLWRKKREFNPSAGRRGVGVPEHPFLQLAERGKPRSRL